MKLPHLLPSIERSGGRALVAHSVDLWYDYELKMLPTYNACLAILDVMANMQLIEINLGEK